MNKLICSSVETLDLLHGGVAEVRAFGRDYPKPIIGYFDNAGALAKAVKAINGGRDIYIGLNPRAKALLDRMPNRLGSCEGGKEADVVCRRWFLIDVDPDRPKGQNSTEEELAEARSVAKAIGLFLKERDIPFAGALSGNGCHILVRLPDYPVNVEIAQKHRLLLGWLGRKFSTSAAKVDLAVHDAPRIARLAGTLNCKGENLPDRPQRMAKLITEKPPAAVDLFKVLATEIGEQRAFEIPRPAEVRHSKETLATFKGDLRTLDVAALFQKAGLYRRDLQGGKHSVSCPWASGHSTGDDRDSSTVVWEADGERWPSFHCSHSHCQGRSMRDVLDYFGASAVDACCRGAFARSAEKVEPEKQIERPAGKPLALVSLRDLLAEPDEAVEWIVDGILPKGGLSVFVAKPKAGKSTLARQLALCVARGEEFLSRDTSPGLVVYLALEERRSDVKAHFRSMGADGEEQIKIFAGMAPADAIAHVREMATIEKPVLIVVDTLARVARIKDLNDYAQTTAGIEPLLAISREVGSHVCFLHHARKGDSKGIDSILGSTGIAGSVDTIVALHRCEKYRTISTIQRVGEDIEESVLDFDAGRRWTSLGGSREQAEIDRTKAAVLYFISGQTEPVEEKAVGEGVEAKRAYRVKALRQLVEEGKIARAGDGKRGAPYLYSVSSTLVPTIYREPENQKPKNELTPCNHRPVSGSRVLPFFVSGSHENTDSKEPSNEGGNSLTADEIAAALGAKVVPLREDF